MITSFITENFYDYAATIHGTWWTLSCNTFLYVPLVQKFVGTTVADWFLFRVSWVDLIGVGCLLISGAKLYANQNLIIQNLRQEETNKVYVTEQDFDLSGWNVEMQMDKVVSKTCRKQKIVPAWGLAECTLHVL